MCQSNGPWSYHPICQAVLLQQIINSIWITAIWFVCCVLHKKVRFCFPSVLYILQHRDCTYKQQKPVLSVSVEESNKDIPHLLWFEALTTNSVIRCFHLVAGIQTAKKRLQIVLWTRKLYFIKFWPTIECLWTTKKRFTFTQPARGN